MKNIKAKVIMLPTEKATKLLTDGHRIVPSLTAKVQSPSLMSSSVVK